MSRIELVLFDMDGLMFDTERLALRFWREALAEWGLVLPDGLFFRMLGVNRVGTMKILRAHYGPKAPLDEVVEERYRLTEEFLTQNGVPMKAGLPELLDVLEKKALRRAVCTSTQRDHALPLLQQAGVLGRFDFVVAGDEIRRGKPDPDIFLRGAQRAGIAPQNCAVLEDSGAGILAASRAGMLPLWVPDLGAPGDETRRLAFREFRNLNEAARFFEADG